MRTEIPAYDPTSFCYFITREEARNLPKHALETEIMREMSEKLDSNGQRKLKPVHRNTSLGVEDIDDEKVRVEFFDKHSQKTNVNNYALAITKISKQTWKTLMETGRFYSNYGFSGDVSITISD